MNSKSKEKDQPDKAGLFFCSYNLKLIACDNTTKDFTDTVGRTITVAVTVTIVLVITAIIAL